MNWYHFNCQIPLPLCQNAMLTFNCFHRLFDDCCCFQHQHWCYCIGRLETIGLFRFAFYFWYSFSLVKVLIQFMREKKLSASEFWRYVAFIETFERFSWGSRTTTQWHQHSAGSTAFSFASKFTGCWKGVYSFVYSILIIKWMTSWLFFV